MPQWKELLEDLLCEVSIESKESRKEIKQCIENGKYTLTAEAIKQYSKSNTDNKDLFIDQKVAKILKRKLNRSKTNCLLHLSLLDFSVPIFTTNLRKVSQRKYY